MSNEHLRTPGDGVHDVVMTDGDLSTDAELMSRTAAGDEVAFRELVERYQQAVFGTCYRMLGSSYQDAEDLSQAVFVKVFRAAGSYRPEALFKTWLMTIVRNTVFTQLKKNRRRRERESDWHHADDDAEPDYPDHETSDASQIAEKKELMRILSNAIHELPPPQRMALILRQYEEMDYEEIARVQGTTVSAVKSLLFRAREQLRQTVVAYRGV